MKKIVELEKELISLGLIDKAREIYAELGGEAALSYVKSSYRLLSKVYHPDKNPQNVDRAKGLQQRLNRISSLFTQVDEEEFYYLLRKGIKKSELRKKRILIVEDEFGLKETFRDVFIMEGYDVRVAVDGEEGLKAYSEFKPDLIFTDVVMPNMSGLELIRKIREVKPDIKAIYISGFFGIKRIKRDLDEDILKYGYHYLSKPFKISAMLELVDSYLNENNEIDLYA